jgi:serine/threonine-protein kinase
MAKMYGERWETKSSLGEGGQGIAYLVVDKNGEQNTEYVLKRLKNLDRIERFKQEIEAVRNLSHPNIINLIDFNLDTNQPYLVTEYCPGGSLEQAQKDNPFWHDSPIVALRLYLEILDGVAYAHSNQIIHRDLKPENIFLREKNGSPVIGDFGICFFEDNGTRITLSEEKVGPRNFIAPELEDG